eukprot:196636-Chlamydomonas_euryale.AAC.2
MPVRRCGPHPGGRSHREPPARVQHHGHVHGHARQELPQRARGAERPVAWKCSGLARGGAACRCEAGLRGPQF